MSEPEPVGTASNEGGTGSFAASRRIAFNAFVRGAGEIIAKAANVLLFVAIARELGKGDFGDFVFGISISGVLLTIAGLGTDDLVAREVARDNSRAGAMFANAIGLKSSLLVVLMGVLGAIVLVGDYDSTARLSVMLVGVATAFDVLTNTAYAVFQAFEKMKFIAAALIAQRILTTILAVIALALGAGLVPVAGMVAVGGVFGFLVSVVLLRRYVPAIKASAHRSEWLDLAKAGIPLGLVTLLFTLLLKLDASMLSFLSDDGNDSVGIYGSAYRLVEATMFLTWAVGGAVLPWLARHEGERGSVGLARGFELGLKGLVGLLLPIAVIYGLYAKELIGFFYGGEFDAAAGVLRLLAAMTVLYGINAFTAILLISRNQPGLFAKAAGLTLIQNAIFNFILIPKYGADGAAVNAIVSGCILAVSGLHLARRVTGSTSKVAMFVTPIGAAAGMAALIWGTGTTALSAVGGLVSYPLFFLLIERQFFRGDFELYIGMLRGFLNRREHDPAPIPPRELGEIGP